MPNWKPIPGLPGYDASDAGEIRSRTRTVTIKRGLKAYRKVVPDTVLVLNHTTRNGRPHYLTVTIRGVTHLAHRLVALAWLGLPSFAKAEVNHVNGDKHDNRPANLEWVTRRENELHSYRVLGKRAGRKPAKGAVARVISNDATEPGKS